MTATLDILTPVQRGQLQAAYDAANAEFTQNRSQQGQWTPVYNLLYDFLTTTNIFGVKTYRTDVPVDPQTWLWLKGARFVNSGEGLFATLIRDYTKAQFQQRYGKPLSDEKANEASNKIAESFIGQWLGKNTSLGETQPDLTQTGLYDAGAAASTVFGPGYTGTTDEDNAAGWAGTILFPNLGAPDFYRKLILDGMRHPDDKAHYATLTSVDHGSYDAIAAAAALETFVRLHESGGLLAGLDWDQFAAYVRQLANGFSVEALADEANADFDSYYALQSGDPIAKVGNDTLGILGFNTRTNIFKTAHYSAGTTGNDIIGVTANAGGAYVRDTNFLPGIDSLSSFFGGIGSKVDVVNAGRGNDLIYGTTGNDILDGGEDRDKISYARSSVVDVVFEQKTSLAPFVARVDKGLLKGSDLLYNFEEIEGSVNADSFSGDTSKLPSGFVIDAGAGGDSIKIKGTKAVTTIGGLGRDYIFNNTRGGIIYGDTIDGLDPLTHTAVADTAANGDNIWWAPGTTLMDPQHSDVLKFYGMPLTGGDSSVGVIFSGIAAALGHGIVGNSDSASQSIRNPSRNLFFDHIFPFITYIVRGGTYRDGVVYGATLYVANLLENVTGALFGSTQGMFDGTTEFDDPLTPEDETKNAQGYMIIRNFDFAQSYNGLAQRRRWSRTVCSVPAARSAANDDDAWPMRPFHFAMGRAA
jgi:hypothetical protein